jgi:hypothetical protein
MACEHRGCECEEGTIQLEGKEFCSDFCATAETQNRHESGCRCGHPECQKA